MSSNQLIKTTDKKNSSLICAIILFIIPIIGPIIFLTWIKPTDKIVKILSIISVFLVNWIFIFFLLGFYKDEFISSNKIPVENDDKKNNSKSD